MTAVRKALRGETHRRGEETRGAKPQLTQRAVRAWQGVKASLRCRTVEQKLSQGRHAAALHVMSPLTPGVRNRRNRYETRMKPHGRRTRPAKTVNSKGKGR